MAGIDYSIPGQFKGLQLESPMNAMAQAMQLRNLQETSQMNALRAQEYELKTREAKETSRQRNALAQYLADPKKPTDALQLEAGVRKVAPLLADQWVDSQLKRGELEEKISERGFRNFDRKFKLYQSFVPGVNSVDGVSQFVSAAYKDPDLAPILTQIRPFEEALNANLDEYNRDPENWKLNAAGVSPDKIMEIARNKAKEEREANKPVVVSPGGVLVSPSGDEIFKAPDREKESNLARLQRELADIVKENPDDPRIAQYKAAITKETTTNLPPSDLARKQSELEILEAQLLKTPNDKKLQEKIRQYRNDIKKDTEFKPPVTNVNVAPPVQTVTVQGPNGPEMRDARTGRLITDDKGQALKPYDASTKPLTPVQQQKLKKDQVADNGKIVAAKNMADDVQKNVDALLGNPDKKIPRHPGYSGITGYNALLPSLPSGNARSAQQLLDNIKGKVTVLGKNLASQEGKLGNMAVQEWKIVADALERIDPAAPNFPDQLRSIATQARRLETNLKTRNAELYPAAPSSSGGGGILDEADAVLKGR
jgi:hypothetical protein